MGVSFVKSTGEDLDELQNTSIVRLWNITRAIYKKGDVCFGGALCEAKIFLGLYKYTRGSEDLLVFTVTMICTSIISGLMRGADIPLITGKKTERKTEKTY